MKHSSRRSFYESGLRINKHSNDRLSEEIEEFDWHNKNIIITKVNKPKQLIVAGLTETEVEQKDKFIGQLYTACMTCSICPIGTECVSKDGIYRDPHLLSNRNISKYVMVCDRPTWDDITNRDNDGHASEIEKLTQVKEILDRLYITYLVKCSSIDRGDYYENCRPFIQLEMNILKPTLIISSGQEPFDRLKADSSLEYKDNVKKITNSIFNIKMLTIADISDVRFIDHIKIVSKLISRLE